MKKKKRSEISHVKFVTCARLTRTFEKAFRIFAAIKLNPMENHSIKPVASNTILVPVDFTSVAETAINHATDLARVFGKNVSLLHVVETGFLDSEKKKEQKEVEAKAQLKVLADKIISTTGVKADYLTDRGNIFDSIGEIAEKHNAALVVMGTHGVHGMQHIVGSRALRVITNANRPFVVVQNKAIRAHGYKNIVLPIDFSKESKQKLVWAAELSKKFHSKFHILADFESDEFAANAVRNNIAYAESYLKKAGCDFTVTRVTKDENFAKETIRFAASIDADLIIIMTNLERDLGDYIIGPYEQTVIANDAQVPVMTLHPVDNMLIQGGILFQ